MTWADTERGRGPVGTAIRTREPAAFRDVTNDPDFAPWRAEALRRGYAAVIGIPILAGSEVLEALAIYAAEPEAFDEDEVQLLRELADDLGYGIVALRTRAAHQRAEEALKRSYDELERRVEERTDELSRANCLLRREIADRERAEAALRSSERLYRQLTEGLLEAIVVADERGLIKLLNPAGQRVFGYEEGEVLGQPLTLLMPPGDRDGHEQALRRYVETRDARSIGSTTEPPGQAERRRALPSGAVALGDRVTGGDHLPRRDPRSDRTPADAGDDRPCREAGVAGLALGRRGPRDQQPPGLRRQQPVHSRA